MSFVAIFVLLRLDSSLKKLKESQQYYLRVIQSNTIINVFQFTWLNSKQRSMSSPGSWWFSWVTAFGSTISEGAPGSCCSLASSSDSTIGCLLFKCRRRLLTPPLSCSFFRQMRQRAAFKLSKCSKSLQIRLRLREFFTDLSWLGSSDISSAKYSWEVSGGPLTGQLVSESLAEVLLLETSSSISTTTE